MSWAEDRRADRAAAANDRIREADAAADRRRRDRTADENTRRNRRKERREKRRLLRTGARTWLAGNRVRVTIALLALASAVMAIPAMATYGYHVYGGATGVVLPVLSELGAWAFTFAVHDARRKHAPVWALLVGVWLFAIGGAAMNVAHGIGHGPGDAAVMGFAAIAGIVAHQLAVASPRKSRTERAEARIERAARKKIEQARQAAIADAVTSIDPSGRVALVFPAGQFRLASKGRLEPVIDPDPFSAEERAIEAARRVLGTSSYPDPSGAGSTPGGVDDDSIGTSSVGVLDPPDDQRKSSSRRPLKRASIPAPKRRSIDEIRQQFKSALADPDVPINPASAESIRQTLGIAPKTARQLRDEHQNGRG